MAKTDKRLFEKFSDELRLLWKTAPRGIILWNVCIIAILIVPAFFNLEVFLVLQGLASFIAFAKMLDGEPDAKDFWVLFTGFSLVMGIFMLVFGFLHLCYKYSFGYLIKQDEIRIAKHKKEVAEKENQLLLEAGEKKNQKLLGN
jgi:hypothetical protein